MSEVLARYAVRRAHVLVVEVPGWWSLRVAVERQVLGRGWQLAESPADADVLVVCGEPGPELAELVDRVWDQLPGPRVRLGLPTVEALDGALDRVATELADTTSHRQDARQRSAAPDSAADSDDMDHGDMDHGDMDHGDMEMAPHGIPLAEGGPDRDGLEMDVLHLPLGPILRHWPAGLVLRCAVQGDVVVEASAAFLDAEHPATPPPGADTHDDRPARLADQACALLSLAGWPDGAASARKVRDALLDGRPGESTTPPLERLRRTVAGSRMLRWSLRGVGPLGAHTLAGHQLRDRLDGDVHDRLVRMLDHALESALESAHGDAPVDHAHDAAPDDAATIVAALPGLVTGMELATVRLFVASLALDPTPTREQATRA